MNYDCRIIRNRLGQYFISIPIPLSIQSMPVPLRDPCTVPERIISLDPGVRTFQTGYDPSGAVFEWGKGDMSRVMRLGYAIDQLVSRSTDKPLNSKKRKRLKKAEHRMRQRIKNLIKDCHRKLAKFLCESFDVILLPSFETSQMVTKEGPKRRKINSKTVRQMLTWSHYGFKQTLLSKAREYPWVDLRIVNEAYTSKTCTWCGVMNEKLGSSKIFHCKSCGTVVDRDYNGARNIYLKNERDLGLCPGSRCGLAPSDGSLGGNSGASSQMQGVWSSFSELLWYDTQCSLWL